MESTPLATTAFVGIVAFVVVSSVLAAVQGTPTLERSRMLRRWTLIAMAWLTVTGLPTILGLVSPTGPILPQVINGVFLVGAIAFALSPGGGRIARAVPLWALVGFQGFRLPLELVLHRWVEAGTAPAQMTWSGQNPDIVTGIVALAAIPLIQRWRSFAWIPTAIGLVLLLNIGRIVVTSLPGPMQRFPEALTLPFHFPHVWIGSVCVVAALVAHILAIRALTR